MRYRHPKRPLSRLAAWLLLAAAGLASAQGILVQDLRDESDSPADIDTPTDLARFNHRYSTSGPSINGDDAQLNLRYAWGLGALQEYPLGTSGPTVQRDLGWSLTISVQDPANQGFSLSVDSRLLGLIGASLDGLGSASTQLPAMRVWMYEAFAPTPQLLGGLSTDDEFAWAGANSQNRQLIDHSGNYNVGRYRGTQSFQFYLKPLSIAAMTLAVNPGSDAYAWQQFGSEFSDPQLTFMNALPAGLVFEAGALRKRQA